MTTDRRDDFDRDHVLDRDPTLPKADSVPPPPTEPSLTAIARNLDAVREDARRTHRIVRQMLARDALRAQTDTERDKRLLSACELLENRQPVVVHMPAQASPHPAAIWAAALALCAAAISSLVIAAAAASVVWAESRQRSPVAVPAAASGPVHVLAYPGVAP